MEEAWEVSRRCMGSVWKVTCKVCRSCTEDCMEGAQKVHRKLHGRCAGGDIIGYGGTIDQLEIS